MKILNCFLFSGSFLSRLEDSLTVKRLLQTGCRVLWYGASVFLLWHESERSPELCYKMPSLVCLLVKFELFCVKKQPNFSFSYILGYINHLILWNMCWADLFLTSLEVFSPGCRQRWIHACLVRTNFCPTEADLCAWLQDTVCLPAPTFLSLFKQPVCILAPRWSVQSITSHLITD